jgi:hypothetical protein
MSTTIEQNHRTTHKQKLLAALAMHTGSLERTRHFTRRFVYTPGVDHLAREARAYWLIDLIASHCRNPKIVSEEFQVWTLTLHANRSATLSVTDGNNGELLRREIHRTDFPLDDITLYLTDGTLLLPSEY